MTNSTIFENPAVTRRAWRWARLCLILVILLSGTSCQQAGWIPGPDKADLEGVWRDVGSPKHLNRFRGDGVLDGSWGGLPFGNAGTWSRNGAKVTVESVRDWTLVADLNGNDLTGNIVERSSGKVIGPQHWHRETRDNNLP